MPFYQIITFPVELTLRATEDGVRMFSNPVKEIARIYNIEHLLKDTFFEPDQNVLSNLNNKTMDIEIEFEYSVYSNLIFQINGRKIIFNAQQESLLSGDMKAPLKPHDGKVHLRLLIDIVIVEVFGNNGRVNVPLQAVPENNLRSVEMHCTGENLRVSLLNVRELESIWAKQ